MISLLFLCFSDYHPLLLSYDYYRGLFEWLPPQFLERVFLNLTEVTIKGKQNRIVASDFTVETTQLKVFYSEIFDTFQKKLF